MTAFVTSEYARSHSGKNYTARCPDCSWVYSGGGNPLAETLVRKAAREHVCAESPSVAP